MVFIEGKHMWPANSLLSEVFQEYKAEDNFLYIMYAEQESFGAKYCE